VAVQYPDCHHHLAETRGIEGAFGAQKCRCADRTCRGRRSCTAAHCAGDRQILGALADDSVGQCVGVIGRVSCAYGGNRLDRCLMPLLGYGEQKFARGATAVGGTTGSSICHVWTLPGDRRGIASHRR
jgi:hypothetical protein